MNMNRRESLKFGVGIGVLPLVGSSTWLEVMSSSVGPANRQHQPAGETGDAQEALQRLREGNERFATARPKHLHESQIWRKQLVAGQHPFATVIGCSDSRVPTEIVFNQGLGDLFVIRVAGNVIAEDVVGSIEYAGLHLHTPLFVVLGHESCGAVTAALDAREGGMSEPEGIQALVRHIAPAIKGIDTSAPRDEQLKRAVEANVRWSVQQLKALPEANRVLTENRIVLTGAVYELDSGRVRWLDKP